MNNLDKEYQMLLEYILGNGVVKQDRTGTGTLSVFGWQIRHKMSEGFPLLTTKKIHFKSVVTELLWFLRGDTNIKFLHDNNCHIWDGDYIKSGRTDGELGPIYGKQWRSWGEYKDEGSSWSMSNDVKGIDQIANLIENLKTNPDSRRLMVNAWNVAELDQMVLPPCHYGFQVYTRELKLTERLRFIKQFNLLEIFEEELSISLETNPQHDIKDFRRDFCNKHNIPTRAISLMWNQRSVDTFLGLPFNIASYGLLLMMIADEVGMIPDELIGNLGDVHLYSNHIEQAKEQISREPFDLPTVHVRDGIESFMPGDIILENYQSHPTIKAPLSN
jgi:thymidylate synthase